MWIIKKSEEGDGFQSWHRDLVSNAQTAITIVVSIGSLDDEDTNKSYDSSLSMDSSRRHDKGETTGLESLADTAAGLYNLSLNRSEEDKDVDDSNVNASHDVERADNLESVEDAVAHAINQFATADDHVSEEGGVKFNPDETIIAAMGVLPFDSHPDGACDWGNVGL